MNSTTLFTRVGRGYTLFAKCASYLACPLLLVIRLYWGWQFFGTGTAKFGDVATFTQRFTEWGVPLPHLSVLFAASTETVCGLLLLAGLASRLVSIPLIFTMIVAYLTAETEALHSLFSDPDKFVSATPFLFLFACVIVLVFGPGVFSLDWVIGKLYAKRTAAPPPENSTTGPSAS
jgi:putative oxidoreductase